jgi:S1-C subfamily serine protease
MTTKRLAVALGLILAIGALSSAWSAQDQQPSSGKPAAQAPELNTILMESTFRLEGRNGKGETWFGTAFLVGRPMKDASKLRYVLVTAAHVIEPLAGDDATLVLRHRINGHWQPVPTAVPIRSKGAPLYAKHPTADVVAMYVRIPTDAAPTTLIPTALLADDKILTEFGVHPGDEVMCLGYPLGAVGNAAGFPILRSGKIASYPLTPTLETQTFLFDFPVFQGNSGGPVYMVSPNRFYDGGTHIGIVQMLLGIVVQEQFLTQSIKELYSSTERRYPLGLAKVAHASFIKETVAMLPDPDITSDEQNSVPSLTGVR